MDNCVNLPRSPCFFARGPWGKEIQQFSALFESVAVHNVHLLCCGMSRRLENERKQLFGGPEYRLDGLVLLKGSKTGVNW